MFIIIKIVYKQALYWIILLLQSDETDVSQFDSKFTKQTPVDSPDDSMLSESANQVFMVTQRFIVISRSLYCVFVSHLTILEESYINIVIQL